MLRVIVVLIGVVLLAACGSSTPTSPAPPPPTFTPPPPPVVRQFSGRVEATLTGEPISGVTVSIGALTSVTDSAGVFAYEWVGVATNSQLTLTAPHIVPRSLVGLVGSAQNLVVDAIVLGNGFDLDYYRRLVRRTLDQPEQPLNLRRWTRAPRIYLKTVDEAGNPIDSATLHQTEIALADEASAWTGGRFGIAEIVRGTDTREGNTEWITVKWPNPAIEGNICGRAQVGFPGGWIELNYLNSSCVCMGSLISPGIVRHEIGHALGFYHTDEPGDILSTQLAYNTWCNGRPSARERFHAAIAYSRPVGNRDPDIDPGSSVQRHIGEPIVVVD